MNYEDEKKIYLKALFEFGIKAQQDMTIEECAELINALEKSRRNRVTKEEIITEIADVMIMCEQMALFYGKEDVDKEKERKLIRLQSKLIKDDI